MSWIAAAALCGLYVAGCRAALGAAGVGTRASLLALLSLIGVFAALPEFSSGPGNPLIVGNHAAGAVRFALYLILVLAWYAALRSFSRSRSERGYVIAFGLPIASLVGYKVVEARGLVPGVGAWSLLAFVGLSYLAFRMSKLVIDVRNEIVEAPTLSEYLAFAFFLPTFVVGPINSFASFRAGLAGPNREMTPVSVSAARVIVGATKYVFLANLMNQLAFANLLGDGHPHPRADYAIAVAAYYLFFYLNFSGFCDMAIGAAGLIGIPVEENFDNPLLATSVRDFWNRWHITLSTYTRDVIFNPTSKFLAKRWGARHVQRAIAVSILLVFTVIGLWHGFAFNYLLFGLLHGGAVVANQYYTIAAKRALGRGGYAAYQANPVVTAVARVLTFWYVAATFVCFYSASVNRSILDELRDHFVLR